MEEEGERGQAAQMTGVLSPRGKRNTVERGEPVQVEKKQKYTQEDFLEEESAENGDGETQLMNNLVSLGLARAVMQPRQPS
jgi:hypothetical protein